MTRTLAALLLACTVAACGWAEWPPPDRGPQLANRPPADSPSTARSRSSRAFVGASAVVVGKGDTVYALSRRHGVPVRAIIEANDLQPPYHLRIGQRIELPRNRTHEVARGDTLYSISRRYGVDTYELARANGIKPPYTIKVGETLLIPGPGESAPDGKPAEKPVRSAALSAPKPPPEPDRPARKSPVPQPPAATGKGFVWPVRGKVISGYGSKGDGLHNDGINIAAPRGTPIKAVENGVVAYAGNELRGFGNLLLIKHADGWITAYAHAERLLVKRGDRVGKGQTIAKVGSSGSVSTPQLHFELRKGKQAVDPKKHLRKA